MHTLLASTPEADWEKLRPVLDEVMDELTESDRTAVLLRFFQHQAFAEVGTVLHVTEDAARMRVERALDKLHALLARRGVTSTTAALGLALTQGGVTAAPTGLAAAATAVALSGAAAGGGTTIAGLLAFMNTTQIAPTVSLMAALVAVSAAVYNVHETRAAETALAAVESQRATATARLQELQRRRKSAATQGGVLLSRAPASARPSIRIGDSADTVERLAAGREFLARHPEVQPMLDEQERRTFDVTTGSRLRTLGLPPADLERIATAAMHATGSRMNIGGVTFELGERPDEPFESPRGKLAELLGSETYQRYVTLQASSLSGLEISESGVG
jgi:hypothetical protein